MSYDDRVNSEFAATVRADMAEARQKALETVGGVFNGNQRDQLQNFFQQQCAMSPRDAREVTETIEKLAEQMGKPKWPEPPLAQQVGALIHDALQGHVPTPFLNNRKNFTDPVTLVTNAVTDLNNRIDALNNPGVSAPVATATATPTTPRR